MVHDKSLIIWDWNGTLLNDADVCITSMNHMLSQRGMAPLTSNRYKEIFRFPVQDYYLDLGFDFRHESFELLSVEFIALYEKLQSDASLHAGAIDLLEEFKRRQIPQVILSAMERNSLIRDVSARGIKEYFVEILGVEDIYANGKTDIARKYLLSSPFHADQVIMLGDTTHDFEVASVLGCPCILIAQGHHASGRLETTGAPVQKNLAGVLNLLINP